MSACEKCWRDAGGSHERYLELLKEREANPCTPEQQAGTAIYHVESSDCWCHPTLDYTNPETGAQHWIHHEPN